MSGNPINYTDPTGYCAGYKGFDAPINTVLSFTGAFMFNGEHWKATGDAWKYAWNTCIESLQKAGAAISRGDYVRAYLYASGFAASSHQATERIGQINYELDIIWCEDASLGDRLVAALDVGLWSIQVSSFITPIGYTAKAWLSNTLSNTYLRGLSFGVPDEFLPSRLTGQWRNWPDTHIAAWELAYNPNLSAAQRTAYTNISATGALNIGRNQGTMVIGGYPEYIQYAQQQGLTYYSLDDPVWSILRNAPDDTIWAINQRALEMRVQAGDIFRVEYSAEKLARNQLYGPGLTYEINFLNNVGFREFDNYLKLFIQLIQ